jgi:hypothetical protein
LIDQSFFPQIRIGGACFASLSLFDIKPRNHKGSLFSFQSTEGQLLYIIVSDIPQWIIQRTSGHQPPCIHLRTSTECIPPKNEHAKNLPTVENVATALMDEHDMRAGKRKYCLTAERIRSHCLHCSTRFAVSVHSCRMFHTALYWVLLQVCSKKSHTANIP